MQRIYGAITYKQGVHEAIGEVLATSLKQAAQTVTGLNDVDVVAQVRIKNKNRLLAKVWGHEGWGYVYGDVGGHA